MPNWCENIVTIGHSDSGLLKSLEGYINDGELCQHILPIPKDEKGGYNECSWCIRNWGTKWDISDVDYSYIDDNTVEVTFSTAWEPPLGLYKRMAEMGFTIQAYYHEGGCAFAGEWRQGEDDEYPVDDCIYYGKWNSEGIRHYVGEELDDLFRISEQVRDCEEEYENNE